MARAGSVVVRDDSEAIRDALGEAIEQVRQLYAESRSQMTMARYDIGTEVRKVMSDQARYGKSGVRRLAKAVARSTFSLYGYAAMSQTWDRKTFADLATRTTKRGVPLSLTHFLLISEQPANIRDALVRFARETGASIRGVRQEAMRLVGCRPRTKRERSAPAFVALSARAAKSTDRTLRRALRTLAGSESGGPLANVLREAIDAQARANEVIARVLDLVHSETGSPEQDEPSLGPMISVVEGL